MSDKNNDQYNEYMYAMKQEHDERENELAGELAQEEGIQLTPGNQMIDREPQDELDRVTNRESYDMFIKFGDDHNELDENFGDDRNDDSGRDEQEEEINEI